MGLRFKGAGSAVHSLSSELSACCVNIRSLFRTYLGFKTGCCEYCAEAQDVLRLRLFIASVNGIKGNEIDKHMYAFEEANQETRVFYAVIYASEKGIFYCYSVPRRTLVFLHGLAKL